MGARRAGLRGLRSRCWARSAADLRGTHPPRARREAGTSRAQTPAGSGRGSEGPRGAEARAPRVDSGGARSTDSRVSAPTRCSGQARFSGRSLSLHESRANVDRTWQGGEYDGPGSNRIRPNPSTAKAISLDLANVLFGQGVRTSHYFDFALPSLNPGRPLSPFLLAQDAQFPR